jgi:L,D-peptidoglycan transpeptidase YkuD (ErfK/YbiS/YcfS/YnhG family)
MAWSDSRQIVLVVTPNWDASQGTLRTYERTVQGWQSRQLPVPVTIGRAGSAWGLGLHPDNPAGPTKKEGDGRSPAGMFRITQAFGYMPSVTTGLSYESMSATDYCIDVSSSPLYNRIVDVDVVGKQAIEGSTEPMRRDLHANGDQRYKIGFVIEHNAKGTAAAGSCIFAHLWKQPGEATAGCTAMDESVMRQLLGWLQADQRPIFALLPQAEYARLKDEWQLP